MSGVDFHFYSGTFPINSERQFFPSLVLFPLWDLGLCLADRHVSQWYENIFMTENLSKTCDFKSDNPMQFYYDCNLLVTFVTYVHLCDKWLQTENFSFHAGYICAYFIIHLILYLHFYPFLLHFLLCHVYR